MPLDHARAARLIAGLEQVRHRLTEEGLEFFYRLLAEFDPSRAAEERACLIAALERMRHCLTDEENKEFDRAIAAHRRLTH